jgi:hypothetical protein
MNGAVVRHAVGDRRYEGPHAATALAPLYTALPTRTSASPTVRP